MPAQMEPQEAIEKPDPDPATLLLLNTELMAHFNRKADNHFLEVNLNLVKCLSRGKACACSFIQRLPIAPNLIAPSGGRNPVFFLFTLKKKE